MEASDLVFSINENNKIMSAGFNINSKLLKNQISKGNSLEEYIIPVGLSYNPKKPEKYIETDYNKVIDSDLYDKLVELTTYKKTKTKRNKAKLNKNKTKRN